MDRFLGVDDFCTYLNSLGYQARRSTQRESERLPPRVFAPDAHCITVEGAGFQLISLHMQGVVGPRQHLKARAFTLKVGPLPLVSRRLFPLRFHFVVFRDLPADLRALEAQLRIVKQGFWNPTIHSLRWTGGQLGARLDNDERLRGLLEASMAADETLRVQPDLEAGCVRIVHGCIRQVDFSLFEREWVRYHQRIAPPELTAAVDRIARHAAAYGSAEGSP